MLLFVHHNNYNISKCSLSPTIHKVQHYIIKYNELQFHVKKVLLLLCHIQKNVG